MLMPYFKCSEYLVSDDGRIYSTKRGKLKELSQTRNGHGYMSVMMSIDAKPYCAIVHTAVARAFVDGYVDGAHVNHKDGDKTNNHANNLEWVTPKENMRHAVDVLGSNKGARNGNARKVKINHGGNEAYFDSIADAIRYLFPSCDQKQINSKVSRVSKALKTNGSCFGCVWKKI